MIRINLLPPEERRPAIPYARVSLFFVIVFIVLLGSLSAVFAGLNWSAERDLAIAKARYDELLPVRQAMARAGDKQKQIDAKTALLGKLENIRVTPYNLMKRVAVAMTNGVWLDETKVKSDNGKILELKGVAVAYPELATFISRLEADPTFSAVTLKNTEGDKDAEKLKFDLELKMKGM